MKKIAFIFLTSLCFITAFGQKNYSIIPYPEIVVAGDGQYMIGSTVTISYPSAFEAEASLFGAYVKNTFGADMKKVGKAAVKIVQDNSLAEEGYKLTVDKSGVTVMGNKTGVFYGLQSLQQLMESSEGVLSVPCVEITDSPRFSYRGLMLDVVRSFWSVDQVKQYIDLMARFKFNRFHWHLNDDQGWRIEIKKHPELTRTGAWRRATQMSADPEDLDRLAHGGFYTQEQIREVVRYAAERHITIIPEIDLPGHATSLVAVYPQLSCRGTKIQVGTEWGIIEDVLCMGNDDAYPVVFDILDEVMELFPGEFINIGGDEAPTVRWERCPKCKARMQEMGMDDPRDLQNEFTRRVSEYLTGKGRSVIGWYEILHGGADHNVTILSWQGEQGGIEAASKGLDVIMSPHIYMYLDYCQAKDRSIEPQCITNSHTNSLDKVYGYEPYTERLTEKEHKYIKGVQGNLWMEYIRSWSHVLYMAYPRVLAVAEIAWSPQREKNYPEFRFRVAKQLAAFDRAGIMFRIPEPLGYDEAVVNNGKVRFELVMPVEGAQIYYTTDGSDPLTRGRLYAGPVEYELQYAQSPAKCIVILPSGRMSAVYTISSK